MSPAPPAFRSLSLFPNPKQIAWLTIKTRYHQTTATDRCAAQLPAVCFPRQGLRRQTNQQTNPESRVPAFRDIPQSSSYCLFLLLSWHVFLIFFFQAWKFTLKIAPLSVYQSCLYNNTADSAVLCTLEPALKQRGCVVLASGALVYRRCPVSFHYFLDFLPVNEVLSAASHFMF